MPPFLDYTLTEDLFLRHVSILAEQGITLQPMHRETSEMLELGQTTISVHGLLRCGEFEFPYTITKHSKGHRFTINVSNARRAACASVESALGRAFPQPERGILKRPQPARRREPGEILTALGCLSFILLIILVCVFAVIGIRSIWK